METIKSKGWKYVKSEEISSDVVVTRFLTKGSIKVNTTNRLRLKKELTRMTLVQVAFDINAQISRTREACQIQNNISYVTNMDMAEQANERLKQFLNEGRNWERKATNIPGVFLFRLLASKGRPQLLRLIQLTPLAPSQRREEQ